jgi:hypothetical protein
MGWLRVDDAFTDHPKIAGLSDRAFRAHVEGLVYCARYLTDGQVPKAKGPTPRVASELERAGLWSSTKRGWVIHDFLDYNPSRSDTLARREARAIAGAKGAASRWQRDRTPDRMSVGDAPVPEPLPLPQDQEQPLATDKPSRPRDELFEALAEVEGADLSALTRSARGKLNAAAKQLREVNATADDVRARAAIYRRVHPSWDLTAPSLVKFWPSLNGSDRFGARPAPSRSVDDMTDEELEELTRGG